MACLQLWPARWRPGRRMRRRGTRRPGRGRGCAGRSRLSRSCLAAPAVGRGPPRPGIG